MPNFDLSTTDGVGFFLQIFVLGFAFLQIYRYNRKITSQMTDVQWFGNSLLLSLLILPITDFIIKHTPQPHPSGIIIIALLNIFFAVGFGYLVALLFNWIDKQKIKHHK